MTPLGPDDVQRIVRRRHRRPRRIVAALRRWVAQHRPAGDGPCDTVLCPLPAPRTEGEQRP